MSRRIYSLNKTQQLALSLNMMLLANGNSPVNQKHVEALSLTGILFAMHK